METVFMITENSKRNEPHKFRLTLADKLNFKDPNKNMALANLSIYYTWKNIKSEYNNNKFNIYDFSMMNLICLMDHILFLTYKIICNTSLKNTRLWQIILL